MILGHKKLYKILRDGEIRKHRLNEMGALNMKWKKLNKLDKRALYSPDMFQHLLDRLKSKKVSEKHLFLLY